jgi:hypothetical protein
MIDALTLATALMGEIAGRDQVLCPGPGHSPHDRSLSIRLDPGARDGFLVHSFASDDWRECRDYVRRALGFPRPEPASRISASRRPGKTTTADALALWERSTNAHDTVIQTYLNSRHLKLPAGDAVIRHRARIGHGEPDAIMVSLMRDVLTDRPVAAHRTFVEHTGRKLWRKIMGPCGGAAIKLEPATDTLVAAEGLETALAAIAAGMTPVWAMGSAGAIGTLPVLPKVISLTILSEVDGGASLDAVAACANRWRGTGKKMFVVRPTIGKDFADVWAHADLRWRDFVVTVGMPI